MHKSLAPVHFPQAVAQCPERDPPPFTKGSVHSTQMILEVSAPPRLPTRPEFSIYLIPLLHQHTANRNQTSRLSPFGFYILSISLLLCSSHSHLKDGKGGKG